MPTALFAGSCFLPQPQQPFPPSEQAVQAIVSACARRKGWKGTRGVRTNAQRLRLPKVRQLPTERDFLPQKQELIWKLLLILLEPTEGFQPLSVQAAPCDHLQSLRVKTAGKGRRLKRNLLGFASCLGLWGHTTSPAWNQVQKPLERAILPPWLVCLEVPSHLPEPCFDPTFQGVLVENSYVGKFSANSFNPLNFWIAMCLCFPNKKFFGF